MKTFKCYYCGETFNDEEDYQSEKRHPICGYCELHDVDMTVEELNQYEYSLIRNGLM